MVGMDTAKSQSLVLTNSTLTLKLDSHNFGLNIPVAPFLKRCALVVGRASVDRYNGYQLAVS